MSIPWAKLADTPAPLSTRSGSVIVPASTFRKAAPAADS